MADSRAKRLEVFRDMMPGLIPDDVTSLADDVAGELGELTIDHVFGALWTRAGLDRRSRSLVTLGALIALRASEELKFHFPIALRNGLTIEEIDEVIYHMTGYAVTRRPPTRAMSRAKCWRTPKLCLTCSPLTRH
jgi:4-carboxymuconolactone decarboxylase